MKAAQAATKSPFSASKQACIIMVSKGRVGRMKRGLILALVLLALTALLFSGAGPFLIEDPQVISVGGGAAGE